MIEPPILCVGMPTDPICSQPAVRVMMIGDEVIGVLCLDHEAQRIREIFRTGICRVTGYSLETAPFSMDEIRRYAEKFRGNLVPLRPPTQETW